MTTVRAQASLADSELAKARDFLSEADTLVKKVTANGYQVFVSESTAGMFRVRVGPYKGRRDAETAVGGLGSQSSYHSGDWRVC